MSRHAGTCPRSKQVGQSKTGWPCWSINRLGGDGTREFVSAGFSPPVMYPEGHHRGEEKGWKSGGIEKEWIGHGRRAFQTKDVRLLGSRKTP